MDTCGQFRSRYHAHGTLTAMSDATDGGPLPGPAGQQRFLQLAEVAEVLNISAAQVYALVRRGEIKAIKIGGRGQWRVETTELEAYIKRLYQETTEFITSHPYGDAETFEES
jgi:excisionase family DNA binding protein